jgi:hypothetical protein
LAGFVYFFIRPPYEAWSALRGGLVVAAIFGLCAVVFGDRLFNALRFWNWFGP